MGRPKKSADNKERAEEDLKALPQFHKAFYLECRKRATNEYERQKIDKFFKESSIHEDFNVHMIEIDWYLENYEDILEATNQSIIKEEEMANAIKQESEYKPSMPSMQKMSQYTQQVKSEPITPSSYYTQGPYTQPQPIKSSYTPSMDYRSMAGDHREGGYYTQPTHPYQPQIQHQQQQPQPQPQPQPQYLGMQRGYIEREEKIPKEYRPQQLDLSQLKHKLSGIIQLNFASILNQIKKTGKEPTENFLITLYTAVSDYVRNLLDELRNIADSENDATDLKNFTKSGESTDMDAQRNTLVAERPMEVPSGLKQLQFLIKFSSIQEDQKQIEKINEKEQKELEEKYSLAKEEDEEKIQKKLKKDFTEQDELIRLLFKSRKDKTQDTESKSKKILETNIFLSNLTSRTASTIAPSQAQETQAQKEHAIRGRKAGSGQKRITMKHLVYYLETTPLYRKTPLLHKAYLK